jgi:Xaa-Pro aminopeptidase
VNKLQEARRQAIRDATEIERLRAAVDIALEAFRQIDRKSAEYLAALNAPKQPGAT